MVTFLIFYTFKRYFIMSVGLIPIRVLSHFYKYPIRKISIRNKKYFSLRQHKSQSSFKKTDPVFSPSYFKFSWLFLSYLSFINLANGIFSISFSNSFIIWLFSSGMYVAPLTRPQRIKAGSSRM